MLDPPECFPAESKKQQPAAGGGCRGECNLGPIPHPTVRRGSKGASVGELQEKLNTVIVVGARSWWTAILVPAPTTRSGSSRPTRASTLTGSSARKHGTPSIVSRYGRSAASDRGAQTSA